MTKTAILRTRVAPDLESDFDALRREKGFSTVSALLHELVKDAVKQRGTSQPKHTLSAAKETSPRTRVVATRLNQAESKKLDNILSTENKSASEFLLCLVRARLNKTAHFGQAELKELREANKQVLAIGRNLNQLVRMVNEGKRKTTMFSEGYADVIREHVQTQSKAITELIKAATKRDVSQ